MVRLNWNAAGSRRFETGVDRGVLYLAEIPGVPWYGLTAVNESTNGGDAEGYYLDGYKYLDVRTSEEFEATLEAFSSPDEFDVCDGTVSIANGLSITQQPRQSFGLSYRTLIGNDLEGSNLGYKLHLVYNATADPADRTHTTVSDSPDAPTLSWALSTKPEKIQGVRPTAHLVVDSTKADPSLVEFLEELLYGTEELNPALPSPREMVSLFRAWNEVIKFEAPNYLGVFDPGKTQVVNRIVDPSFETSGIPVQVRRNGQPNPKTVGAEDSVYVSVTGTAAFSEGLVPRVVDGHEFTPRRNTCTGTGTTRIGLNKAGFSVPEGVTTIVAMDVYIPSSYSWGDNTGAFICRDNPNNDSEAADILSYDGTLIPDQWCRVWVRFRPKPGRTVTNVYFTPSGTPVVDQWWEWTRVIEDPTGEAYFDGDFVPSEEFTSLWEGEVDNSTSALYGTSHYQGQPAVNLSSGFLTSTWAKSGSRSICIMPTANLNDTHVHVGGDTGGLRLGMLPGKTYTAMVTIRLVAPITGELHERARTITVHHKTADSAYGELLSDPAPNLPGEHEIRFTFTIPEDATEAFIRLYHGGSAGNGLVWFDDFLLVDGVYTGPYFDGSSGELQYENQAATTRWGGLENLSTSVLEFYDGLPAPAAPGDFGFMDQDVWYFSDGIWIKG